MRFEQFDLADLDSVRVWYEMQLAGKPVDDPLGPMASLRVFAGWFTEGGEYARQEAWFIPGERAGTWAGAYSLHMPTRDNTHRALISLIVPPDRRRRGAGSALVRHAVERCARHGRTMLRGGALEGSPGAAFAAAVGAQHVMTDIRRVLDMAGIPAGQLAGLREKAERAARGYSLVSWTGITPEAYLDGVAAVSAALDDAPHSPGYEPVPMDADRVREEERRIALQELRYYTVAARWDQTGELAGVTMIGVDPGVPDWGHQELTAVSRPHRGHRLGLLTKVVMLQWLAEAEPGLKHVITDNASANNHMISINEDLGFRVLDQWQRWHLDVPQASAGPVPATSAAAAT